MFFYSQMKKRVSCFLALLLSWLFLSGCGLIWDTGAQVSSISLPPGDLFRAEFYQTATPDDVRKAIGKRSLAGENYQEKQFERDRGGFLFSESDMRIMGIFIPTTSVSKSQPVYPLTLAMTHSPYPDVIALLADAGADTREFNIFSNWKAFKPESVKALLEHSDSAELRCTALVKYAELGQLDLVKFIISLKPDVINCKVTNAETALISAAKQGQIDMLSYLIKQGALLELRDIGQYTALSYAVHWNQVEAAKLLLQHGADGSGLYPERLLGEKTLTLLNLAQKAKINDSNLLVLLTEQSPVEGTSGENALTALCLLDKPMLVKRLQARGAHFPAGQSCTTIKKKDSTKT